LTFLLGARRFQLSRGTTSKRSPKMKNLLKKIQRAFGLSGPTFQELTDQERKEMVRYLETGFSNLTARR
jgi:hypothetical protein